MAEGGAVNAPPVPDQLGKVGRPAVGARQGQAEAS